MLCKHDFVRFIVDLFVGPFKKEKKKEKKRDGEEEKRKEKKRKEKKTETRMTASVLKTRPKFTKG